MSAPDEKQIRNWQRVNGVHSPIVKDVQRLQSKKGRVETRLFLVEGGISVAEALRGARVRRILAREDAMDEADALVDGLQALGYRKIPELFSLSYEAMSRAATTDSPPPVMAVVEQNDVPLSKLPQDGELYLACVRMNDPGNLGTIIRAADGLGASGLLVSSGTVETYNPKVVRSTMGSMFRLPMSIGLSVEKQVAFARDRGLRIVAALSEGGTPAHMADLATPMLLMLGAEVAGVPASVLAEADEKVTVHTPGDAESLNVAVAASILMYESLRQRTLLGL